MIARTTIVGGGASTAKATIWTSTLQHYTGYSEKEVKPVARAVLRAWAKRQDKCNAVVKKHLHPKFGQIAAVPLPSADGF